MKRTGPEALGVLVAAGCLVLTVRSFLAGNVPAELAWIALGGAAFTLGRLLGTGRGWLPWAVLALALAAASWWAAHPALGVVAAVAAAAASVIVHRVLRARKEATRYLMKLAGMLGKETKDQREPEEILTPLRGRLIPKDETRAGARVGLPVRWNVPPHVPVDERARLTLGAAVTASCLVPATYRIKRSHIDVLPAPRPVAEDSVDAAESEQVEEINQAIRPAMGPELAVKSTERDEDGNLTAITLTWPPSYTNKATSPPVRNRVGKALPGIVGGSWNSAGWDTESRTATYRRMPNLEGMIPHPGPDTDHPDRVPFATLRNGGTAYMSLGDENPHCLIAGTTSRGKTSLIRALLVGMPEAARADLIDPKQVSLLGTEQLDMVTSVATEPDAMALSIQKFREEMLDRNRRLKLREATVKKLQRSPRVLVIDEAEMLFDMLDDWWRTEEKDRVKDEQAARTKLKAELISKQQQVDGETDVDKMPPLPSASGTRHPAIVWFKNILQAGRQAGMYVIMASQQNDASWLGTSARNQFGTRISLGNLDQVGSRQVFGTMGATSGLDSHKGRAWVGMGSGNIFPQQAQTWWVPELDSDVSDDDRAILDRLGLTVPEDYEQPEPGEEKSLPKLGTGDHETLGNGTACGGEDTPEETPSAATEEHEPPAATSKETPHPDTTGNKPNEDEDVKADHGQKPEASQLSADHGETELPGPPDAESADTDDEAEGDRPQGETESVDALDLEEGDQVHLDLGERGFGVVEVVSVEVDTHDTEQLEVTYRDGDDVAVLSIPEDEPVERLVTVA